ncbi:MAG: T9SS type A sorting domain-containing protein [Bacteroidia bacterium]
MKGIISLLLLLLMWPLAQAGNSPESRTDGRQKVFYTDIKTLEANGLQSLFDLRAHESLLEIQRIESSGFIHYQFQHQIHGKPLLFSKVNVHIYPSGAVYIQDFLLETPSEVEKAAWADAYTIYNGEVIALTKSLNSALEIEQWEYRSSNRELLYSFDKYRYAGDTTVKAKVFMVNPVNSANVVYGGAYTDNNDMNSTALQDELYEVSVHAVYENDSFKLDHPKVHLKDFSFPTHQDDYTKGNDSFFYNRSQIEFEAVNAYYHLVTYYEYLESLGFDHLALAVDVDVHGFNGSDNSRFDPNTYSIEFGDGGVDDAEDAEVVIHEYVHSLSTTAHVTSTPTRQREAMEEGNCDYLSKSYSRSINDNNSYKVFSWDGHNEFWNGFIINSSDHYPEDLKNTKDGDRDIWSSTLMCIHDLIGREATDSLVLEHFNYQSDDANMIDMAKVLMHLDSALFNHRYYGAIRGCLEARGLADHLVNVDDVHTPEGLEIKNSLEFQQGLSSLEIVHQNPISIKIYNSAGQLLDEITSNGHLSLDPQDFVPGLYILHLESKNQQSVVKILR